MSSPLTSIYYHACFARCRPLISSFNPFLWGPTRVILASAWCALKEEGRLKRIGVLCSRRPTITIRTQRAMEFGGGDDGFTHILFWKVMMIVSMPLGSQRPISFLLLCHCSSNLLLDLPTPWPERIIILQAWSHLIK